MHSPVHPLKAAGVIEEGDGQRVGEQALRRGRIELAGNSADLLNRADEVRALYL